jgi:hypothetical protein
MGAKITGLDSGTVPMATRREGKQGVNEST